MSTIAERIHFFLASLGDYMPILLPLGIGLALLVPPAILTQAFIVSLGFQTFFIDIGTTITAPRILGVAALLSFLLVSPQALGRAWRQYPARDYLVLFMLFLGASIILNLPFLPEKDTATTLAPVNDMLFRGRVGRGLFQWLVIALRATTPLLFLAYCRRPGDVRKLLRFVLIVTTAVCLYGLYQVVAYKHDLPAIYLYRGFHDPIGRTVGQFHLLDQNLAPSAKPIFRISSLLGEPRDLAAFLLPVTVFLGVFAFSRQSFHSEQRKNRRMMAVWILFLLHAVVFLGTFSTGGWVAGILSILAVWWFLRGTTVVKRFFVILSVSAILAAIAVSLFPRVWNVLDVRLLQRLSFTTVENPVYGVPQLSHMIRTWPHTIFVGASPGGSLLYEDYLGSEIGLVHYLTDLGIIGTGVLVLFCVRVFHHLRDVQRRDADDSTALALVSAVIAAMVSLIAFPTPEVISSLWVFLGLAAAYRVTKEERLRSS